MAQVTLEVKVVRTQIDKLQKDIDKLNNTTINIKTSQSVREVTKLETATRQLIKTDKERQREEQENAKTQQQQERAERDRQNAINATNRAKQSQINLERTRARQQRENERETERLANAEKKADKETQEHNKNLKQQGLLYDILGRSLSSFIARMTMYRAVYAGIRAITNGMTEALQTMKQVDDQLVSVRKVTGFDDATLKRIEENAYKTASQYGTTAPEYMESVVRFSQAGYKNLSSDLAELSTKTQIVGDLTGEVADQFLLSVDAAYKYNGSITELSRVLDGLNEIENNNATSIEKMAEGMGIVAPVAAQMHVSVDELAASLGVITAVTQRSGTEAARALRAIYLNIVGDTKTEIEEGVTWTTGEIEGLRDIIKVYAKDAYEAAQATGGIIDPMEAIAGLAQSLKDGLLTEAELMEMVSDIGGKLRTSQLLALINNWDMYETMLQQYRDAYGSADKEIENAMDSWTRKTNVLKNTWTEFVQKSLNGELMKGFIDALNWIIKGLGNLENALKIILGLLVAAKLGQFLNGLNLILGALDLMVPGFKSTISVLLSYRSSMKAAEIEGKALEAQQLAIDAANKKAAMSFNWLSAVIAILTIAYTAYTIASNKAEEANEKALEASYKAAEKAKTHSENLMQVYVETTKADISAENYNETLKDLAQTLGTTLPDSADEAIEKLRELTEEQLLADQASINSAKILSGDAFVKTSNKQAVADGSMLDVSNDELLFDDVGNDVEKYYAESPTLKNLVRKFFTDTRFYKDQGEGSGMRYKLIEFDDVEDAVAYRKALEEIVAAYEQYAYETGNATDLHKEFYLSAKAYLSETQEAFDKYTSLVGQQLQNEAILQVAKDLRTITIDSQEAFDGYIQSIQDSTEYSDEFKLMLIDIAKRYFPEYVEAVDDGTNAIGKNTDAVEANISAQDRLNAAKERATAAARALIPALFDENGQLTAQAAEALRTSSYLADLVQTEIDLQNETNRANYARMRAELALLSSEAVRTAKAIMAAYAASASMMTLKLYALENGATPDVMKAITILSILDSLDAKISAGVNYSGQIEPYTSNYKPPSSSGSSGGSSGSSSGSSGSSSGSSSTEKKEDEKLKAYQKNVTLLKSELALMQERGDPKDKQIEKMKEIQAALHDEAEYLRSIGADQATINGLSQEWWSYHNKIESIMSEEADDAERQAKAIQEAVDAQLALNNALSQRTVRVYNASTGRWEWSANPNDVKSAQDTYNKAMANLSPSDMDAYNAALAKAYAPTTGFRGSELFVEWLKGNGNSGGSTHNGNNYNFGNFTFSEAQAKGISLYDLAQLSRSLAICG